MVLHRIPKFIGRTKDKEDIAHLLLLRANVNIRNYLDKLIAIQQNLQK